MISIYTVHICCHCWCHGSTYLRIPPICLPQLYWETITEHGLIDKLMKRQLLWSMSCLEIDWQTQSLSKQEALINPQNLLWTHPSRVIPLSKLWWTTGARICDRMFNCKYTWPLNLLAQPLNVFLAVCEWEKSLLWFLIFSVFLLKKKGGVVFTGSRGSGNIEKTVIISWFNKIILFLVLLRLYTIRHIMHYFFIEQSADLQ